MQLQNMEIMQLVHAKNEQAIKLLNTLSASQIHSPISYLFFLNASGRYVADVFFVEHENNLFLIAPEITLQNLITHLKKFDIRNELAFIETEICVSYTLAPTNFASGNYKDPRDASLGYIALTDSAQNSISEAEYNKLIIQAEIAEFQDFEHERSIVLEFGKIAEFIGQNKGCYPGQELMHRTHVSGQIRKTVRKTILGDESIIRALKQDGDNVLALCRL